MFEALGFGDVAFFGTKMKGAGLKLQILWSKLYILWDWVMFQLNYFANNSEPISSLFVNSNEMWFGKNSSIHVSFLFLVQ